MRCSVYIVCPSLLRCSNLKLHQTLLKVKNIFKQENVMLQLTFNHGLTLTGFRTTRPSIPGASVVSDYLLVAWGTLSRSRFFFTWLTFRQYCTPSASTRTLLRFFWTTVNGECRWQFVFFLLSRTNTLSPPWILLSCAFLLQSAYTFPYPFLSLSRSLTSSSAVNSCSWGSLILIRTLFPH